MCAAANRLGPVHGYFYMRIRARDGLTQSGTSPRPTTGYASTGRTPTPYAGAVAPKTHLNQRPENRPRTDYGHDRTTVHVHVTHCFLGAILAVHNNAVTRLRCHTDRHVRVPDSGSFHGGDRSIAPPLDPPQAPWWRGDRASYGMKGNSQPVSSAPSAASISAAFGRRP